MNYVVFDLEWNQPQDGVKTEDRTLPFEILEIGAVKLNERFEIIDKYDQLIKPQVYSEINWRIRKMLDLKPGELERGRLFPRAASEFLRWCGEDFIWCTWGSQDLTELNRNMAYYKLPPLSDKPVPYLNVQKIYGHMVGNTAQSRALSTAVEELKIPMYVPFHRAYGDAYYTAKILACLPEDLRQKIISFESAKPLSKRKAAGLRRSHRRRVRRDSAEESTV